MTVMFIRSFITYILLLLVLRLMGKRQIGELQPSELVTTLLLSEVASQPVTDDNIPLVYGLVPVAAILSFEVILSFAITKNKKFKKIMTGEISVLIDKGKLNMKEMKKNRISLEELASELRQKNIADISRVQYAIMEKNGKISVIEKAEYQPCTLEDMNIQSEERGIAHAFIVDGEICYENIESSGKNEEFLKKELEKRKIKSAEDIVLFTCDDAGNINIIRKE
ncbi:MAG: DUF421 domain-containing protein [Clostridia bacterium]|nr:DUF421 domain-containing protein [Clostridia bacterium]